MFTRLDFTTTHITPKTLNAGFELFRHGGFSGRAKPGYDETPHKLAPEFSNPHDSLTAVELGASVPVNSRFGGSGIFRLGTTVDATPSGGSGFVKGAPRCTRTPSGQTAKLMPGELQRGIKKQFRAHWNAAESSVPRQNRPGIYLFGKQLGFSFGPGQIKLNIRVLPQEVTISYATSLGEELYTLDCLSSSTPMIVARLLILQVTQADTIETVALYYTGKRWEPFDQQVSPTAIVTTPVKANPKLDGAPGQTVFIKSTLDDKQYSEARLSNNELITHLDGPEEAPLWAGPKSNCYVFDEFQALLGVWIENPDQAGTHFFLTAVRIRELNPDLPKELFAKKTSLIHDR